MYIPKLRLYKTIPGSANTNTFCNKTLEENNIIEKILSQSSKSNGIFCLSLHKGDGDKLFHGVLCSSPHVRGGDKNFFKQNLSL